MAEANEAALAALEAEVGISIADLDKLAGAEEPTELKPITVREPPKMAWVLVGIPTVRFGEISTHVEAIAAVSGSIVESTVTD